MRSTPVWPWLLAATGLPTLAYAVYVLLSSLIRQRSALRRARGEVRALLGTPAAERHAQWASGVFRALEGVDPLAIRRDPELRDAWSSATRTVALAGPTTVSPAREGGAQVAEERRERASTRFQLGMAAAALLGALWLAPCSKFPPPTTERASVVLHSKEADRQEDADDQASIDVYADSGKFFKDWCDPRVEKKALIEVVANEGGYPRSW